MNDNGKRSRESVGANIQAIVRDLKPLIDFRNELEEKHRESFRRQFGKVDHLMDVKVDERAIRAFLKYYMNKIRVFVFPNFDLTPTLEEYHYLLSPNWLDTDKKIHVPDLSKAIVLENPMKRVLQEKCGISPTRSENAITTRNGKTQICWTLIYENMKKEGKRIKKFEHAINFLALGIYGLVLFPTAVNCVESRVMDMVMEVKQNSNINIMPHVLAETFRTFDFLKRNVKGEMRCCTQLLTMWIHSHFPLGEKINYDSMFMKTSLPVEKFCKEDKQGDMLMEEWK